MLHDTQVAGYLTRLAWSGRPAPTRANLDALHQAHLRHLPFENYDVMFGTPVVLTVEALYQKLVERKRGGFCYELNALFGELLQTLGFKVTLFAAGVFSGEEYSYQFDHLLLGVELDGENLIADVGFGNSFLMQLETRNGWHTLHATEPGKTGKPQYRFLPVPRALPDFAARCHFQQTSPESHFTQRAVCSIATVSGRITLSNGRHIVTTGGVRSERQLVDEMQYRAILKRDFGITLGPDYDISLLLGKA
jgi:N-hydroxyarylamine O-acetyltransferase